MDPTVIANNAPQNDLSQILQTWQQGEGTDFKALFEKAYGELKQIAAVRIAQVAGHSTLTPTELLHEAVLRVMGTAMTWQNRAHFFASMSIYMRSILIDHARARMSDKRGGGALHLTLTRNDDGDESGIADLLALDAALKQLEQLDQRSSAVLHLTYFAGLERREIAEVLKVSVQIVDRELRFAKSWLNTHLDTHL